VVCSRENLYFTFTGSVWTPNDMLIS